MRVDNITDAKMLQFSTQHVLKSGKASNITNIIIINLRGVSTKLNKYNAVVTLTLVQH